MGATPSIVADKLVKQFATDAVPAVDGCSFSVDAGELIVLLGPSGCGKTTLLKMINRLYEPTAGRLVVNGTDVTQLPATALRRQIGYVIQQTGLFPHMRIEDNIAVVPRLLDWERPRIDARIDELLELIGLPLDYRRRYPRQLSGGEQQRVGIARALAADPALLLMDEPFGAIDAITRTRLQDELLLIQSKLHKTIMFVTHDVDEALRLADRIIVMQAGKIVQFDTPLNLLMHPADEFVTRLVAAGDMIRRLRLMPVEAAMQPGRPEPQRGDQAVVAAGTDLRSALSQLIGSGRDALSVVDATGKVVGALSFDDIQAATRAAEAAERT